MNKLQVLKKVVHFQQKMFELDSKREKTATAVVNELLLSKVDESSRSNVTLCVSQKDICIYDEVTGLSSMVRINKVQKNFAIMVDLSKMRDIDILSNFISDVNSGQIDSKLDNKIAIILANADEDQDMNIFDKKMLFQTYESVVDNYLVGA